jgi:hypothetical protein
VKEISLVDLAANLRNFVMIKAKEGGPNKMDAQELVLFQNVEKALNALNTSIEGLSKDIEPVIALNKALNGDIDIEKAGAKFSKANLAHIKAAHSALGKLMEGIEKGGGTGKDEDELKDEKAEKGLSGDDLTKRISASMTKALGTGNDKEENEKSVELLTKALKVLIGTEDDKNKTEE